MEVTGTLQTDNTMLTDGARDFTPFAETATP